MDVATIAKRLSDRFPKYTFETAGNHSVKMLVHDIPIAAFTSNGTVSVFTQFYEGAIKKGNKLPPLHEFLQGDFEECLSTIESLFGIQRN